MTVHARLADVFNREYQSHRPDESWESVMRSVARQIAVTLYPGDTRAEACSREQFTSDANMSGLFTDEIDSSSPAMSGMSDDARTTAYAEELRESTNLTWEECCLRAERRRDMIAAGQYVGFSVGEVAAINAREAAHVLAASSPDDMRAIYSAASAHLRSLYADQESPHATKDNATRLARIAETLHHGVPRS